MKVIVPMIETAEKMVNIKGSDIDLKTSVFSVTVSCDEGTLYYHTLTGEMILIEADDSEDEVINQLIRHRFVIPADTDEHQLALQLRKVVSLMNHKKAKSSFLVTTTTDCNARCFYCFELGHKRISMSEETAKAAASYMIRVSGDEELKLTWFGGEPLCNTKAIDTVCTELKKKGKKFRSVLVSNGYYLDREMSTKAYRDWNLGLVQITLDGTKDIYQQTKAYVEKDPDAYERVIDNIRGASEAGISVVIRLNMDAANADDLFHLADELKTSLPGCSNITGHCELLREYIGSIRHFPSEEDAVEVYRKLQNKLDKQWPRKKEGLLRNIPVNSCMADNDSCETIFPDGNISKCDCIDFSSITGNVASGYEDPEEIMKWKETVTFPECSNCPVFPQCIVLKRCKGIKNGCPESLRLRNLLDIKDRMINEYDRYRKESKRIN